MVVIKKRTVKIVSVIVVLVVLYIAYQWLFGASYPDIFTPKPVFGNPDANVKIIEFSDLQCPACKAAHPVVQQIKEEFGENISFQYYHFPLRAIHPYAQKAAEAVECAHDQGKFWEYLDVAFSASPELQNRNLKKLAGAVGLDVEKFSACLDSGSKWKVVDGDYRFGTVRDVLGTPTFFINEKKLDRWDYETIKAAIERELG